MSVVAFFHPTRTLPRRGLRTALSGLLDRIAASPLDSSVLQAVDAQAPAGPPVRMRARWEAVTAADGSSRLRASWHAEN
ncbi:hypothetical protein [Kitasatospora aureofaciens]|uniref:hypothetical protein n=1 Tax=Kitasatospora aureofaciens TaxID=1894 RepID=UPI001C46CE97|nr:hypothetical protein [Kitasatospora aureofaciens]MBV6695806.1 hypothetical protein [Kitasatospora aureofaciens]